MRLTTVLLAFAIAGGVALVAYLIFAGQPEERTPVVVSPQQPQTQAVPETAVLVASRPLPVGHVIVAGDVDPQPWPGHLVLSDFLVSDPQQDRAVVGMVTRSSFSAREPLTRNKLANPNDPGFLAAALPAGQRAVTIGVDRVAGMAGLLFPGDYVDVIATHDVQIDTQLSLEGKLPDPERVTEVVVPKARVLAVDRRTGPAPEGEKIPDPATVTLQVSQYDVQRLKLAESRGRLTVALRSLHDQGEGHEVAGGMSVMIAPPTTLQDLSRITPRSYYPVLFDRDAMYQPQVVDPFSPDMLAGVGATKPTGMREKMNTVTIYRGTAKETIGVDRP